MGLEKPSLRILNRLYRRNKFQVPNVSISVLNFVKKNGACIVFYKCMIIVHNNMYFGLLFLRSSRKTIANVLCALLTVWSVYFVAFQMIVLLFFLLY